jgi:hypothetical protein
MIRSLSARVHLLSDANILSRPQDLVLMVDLPGPNPETKTLTRISYDGVYGTVSAVGVLCCAHPDFPIWNLCSQYHV